MRHQFTSLFGTKRDSQGGGSAVGNLIFNLERIAAPTAAPASMPPGRAPMRDPRRPTGARREVSRSPNAGSARDAPRIPRARALAVLSWPVESPAVASTEASSTDRVRKLAPNPRTIPTARRLFPPPAAPSTSGTTGSVQGARIVSSPPTKANVRTSGMARSALDRLRGAKQRGGGHQGPRRRDSRGRPNKARIDSSRNEPGDTLRVARDEMMTDDPRGAGGELRVQSARVPSSDVRRALLLICAVALAISTNYTNHGPVPRLHQWRVRVERGERGRHRDRVLPGLGDAHALRRRAGGSLRAAPGGDRRFSP